MSAPMVQAVLAAEIAPCSAKFVAVALAWHCNADTGHAWPSMGTLAAETSMSARHAKRAISTLKTLGVVLIVKASAGGAHRSTTTYAFNPDRLAELANPVRRRAGDTGAPRAPVSLHGGRGRHLPSAPVSPKRDEREKASPSLLSSKTRPSPSAGGAAAGRASSTPSAASPRVVLVATGKTNSQQPLDKGKGNAPFLWEPYGKTVAEIRARGDSLGCEPFDTDRPEEWGKYLVRVANAAAKAWRDAGGLRQVKGAAL